MSLYHHNKQRYLFIDLLRFLAVVFMLQGHTFDALLSVTVKESSLFHFHDFFHGFVAPMFLFASGVAFGISTFKKWEDHIVVSGAVRKRVGRFLGLIIIGYALHLPFFSLRKILDESSSEQIAAFLQVDALQCIAVTLLFLQILVLVVRREKIIALVAAVLGPTVVLTSPVVWSYSFKKIFPLPVASYFNAENNSWFPLFPWSAYVLFGVVFAYTFIEAKEHHHAVRLMKRGAILGTLAIVLAAIAAHIPIKIYPDHDFWKVNPAVVVARVGFVSVVASGLFFLEHNIRIPSRLPTIMGRESLMIYVLHLLIIYGSAVNNGLEYTLRGKLSLGEALGVFLAVLFFMSVFAYSWYMLKTKYHRSSLMLKIALTTIFLFYFVTRPY